MTVGELEELLAMLPADMAVVVISDGGCRHITQVVKTNRQRCRHQDLGLAGCAALDDGRHPAELQLRAQAYRAPLWFEAFGCDVDFEVSGRWPARQRRDPIARVPSRVPRPGGHWTP